MKANKIILLLSCLSLLVACSNTDTTASNKIGSVNKTTSIESRTDSKLSSGNDAQKNVNLPDVINNEIFDLVVEDTNFTVEKDNENAAMYVFLITSEN